jgi:hypothetical protein
LDLDWLVAEIAPLVDGDAVTSHAQVASYVLTAADRRTTCANENFINRGCRDGPHDPYNTRTLLYIRALAILHLIVQPRVQRS